MHMNPQHNQGISPEDIDILEKELFDFSQKWKVNQSKRTNKWRKMLFFGFVTSLVTGFLFPQLWWVAIILIAYSAGALFMIIDQEAKTTTQLIKHKHQLKLARLLIKYDSTL